MSEKSNKMKPRSASQIRKATREFTDRDEPRAAFWKEYAALKEELKDECYIHVLNYYGIGGIGKTSLLKKLAAELEETIAKPIYAYINLEYSLESRVILERIKNKLQEKAKFSFPLLDLGLYVYAKKLGESADSPKIRQLTEKSPVLSLLLSVVDTIPVISIASKLLSLADKSVAYIRNYLHMHSRELSKIEYMEPEELYKYLPVLFSIDMSNNTKSAKEPVVIFLDSYEFLVNELSQVGEPLKNDEWIRGEEGLVLNSSGVLWVIAGRERLRWGRFDSGWDETISSHILGNLSMADSLRFLEKAGVGGAELRNELFALTNGTPVYLDLCVDQFMQISEGGETPDISMFGKDTFDLIERFMRYMDDSHKDYVYLLACLRNWDDPLFFEMAEAALSNFSITSYDKTKNLSFIIAAGDGEYSIHKTVGEVLMGHCPQIIKERTGKALIDRFLKSAAAAGRYSEEFATALRYLTLGALLKYEDREELCEFYIRELRDYIFDLAKSYNPDMAAPILELMEEKASDCAEDRLAAEIMLAGSELCIHKGYITEALKKCRGANDILLRLLPEDDIDLLVAKEYLSCALLSAGDIDNALKTANEVYEEYRRKFGDDSEEVIYPMSQLADAMKEVGNLDEALKLSWKVLRSCERCYGEIDKRSVTAMNNLASCLQDKGELQEAVKMQRLVLIKRRSLYEECDHPVLIGAENNLCASLIELGETEEALEMLELTLEKCRNKLGDKHPTTLAVKENMSRCREVMGMHAEAYALRNEVLETRKEILEENHFSVLETMIHLGNSACELGNLEEARKHYEEALDKALRKYGENHAVVSIAKHNLEIMQRKMRAKQEAEMDVFDLIDFENFPCN